MLSNTILFAGQLQSLKNGNYLAYYLQTPSKYLSKNIFVYSFQNVKDIGYC